MVKMNYCYSQPKFMFYARCLVLCAFFLAAFGPVSTAEVQKAQKVKKGNYITEGSFVGGEFADGLDVKTIRWADHRNYERLVFDIYRWGGPNSPEGLLPNEYPGSFEMKFINDKKIVMIFLYLANL